MKTSPTSELVKNELKGSMFINELLKENLINHSSLARKLLPKIKKQNTKATFESVLITIKRYSSSLPKQKISNELKKIIADSELLMKNDIVELTIERTPTIFQFFNDLSKEIRWDLGEIFFIIQGSGEITLIMDKKNQEKFKKLKPSVIEKRENMALISIR